MNDHIIQGLWTLLNHLQLLDDSKYENSFQLLNYGSYGYMYVSNATLQALEIFSISSDFGMVFYSKFWTRGKEIKPLWLIK